MVILKIRKFSDSEFTKIALFDGTYDKYKKLSPKNENILITTAYLTYRIWHDGFVEIQYKPGKFKGYGQIY